ncbi:MAG: hypothetical protein AAGI45_10430 [Cyanobacteria bacterium P01_H01_bin.26]
MMTLSTAEATTLAMNFLMDDLEIPHGDQEFFSVLSTRAAGSEWYVVEIGVEGLPDKWVLQVFDTGRCDPCYTFTSPMPAAADADLEAFPEQIAKVVTMERAGNGS